MEKKKNATWAQIKKEYITTKKTLKEVASNYDGLSYSSVSKRSAKEGWVDEREEYWDKATKEAIEETEGSVKNLIKRHSKIARFLQAGGLKRLKVLIQKAEVDPSFEIKPHNLIRMVSEGLEAERDLYPKQMKVKGEVKVKQGYSKEVEEIVEEAVEKSYDRLKRRLTSSSSGETKEG